MTADLLIALRRLAHERTLFLLVVVTLATVGGVSSAVLGVAYDMHMRPLSYPEPHTLLRITGRSADVVGTVNVSPPDFRDLRRDLTSFASLAAVSPFTPQLTLTGIADPRVIDARRISSRYFETLGLRLLAGREFVEAEEQPPARPVVISEHFWKSTLQEAEALGHSLTMNGEAYQIVGIAPDREEVFGRPDIWLPMQFPSEAIRGLRIMAVVGRTRAGTTVATAQAELTRVGETLQRAYPPTNARWQPAATPLAESVSAPLRSALSLMVAVVLVLWAAACAALGGIALSRTLQRADELAVRKALGATAWQTLRAATADYVVAGAAGFVGAVALSYWMTSSLRLLGLTPPIYASDWRLTLISVSALIMVAMGTAVAAAAFTWRRTLPSQRMRRTIARAPRNLLVAGQVVIAIAVVGVAGMLLGGLVRLRTVDSGFDPNGASYFSIALPPRYATSPARAQFWAQIVDQLQQVPGVSAAALTSELPFTGQENPTAFAATTPDGQQASVQLRSISPSYFAAARVPVVRGRAFKAQDDGAHPNVIIVNQIAARMIFGSGNPIGGRLALNFTSPPHTAEIIGVAATIRHSGPGAAELPEVYAPTAQTPLPRYTVLLRSERTPEALFRAVARQVHDADGDLAVDIPRRWSDAVAGQFEIHQTRLTLVSILAALAVLLAGLSAFGTISEMLGMRSQEFAVRLALGAAPSSLIRMLGADLAGYLLAAVIGGGVLMSMVRKWVSSAMSGIALPQGWPELSALAVVVIAVSMATWLPARRIKQIDPAQVLRT